MRGRRSSPGEGSGGDRPVPASRVGFRVLGREGGERNGEGGASAWYLQQGGRRAKEERNANGLLQPLQAGRAELVSLGRGTNFLLPVRVAAGRRIGAVGSKEPFIAPFSPVFSRSISKFELVLRMTKGKSFEFIAGV
jgi:hypothetical protein